MSKLVVCPICKGEGRIPVETSGPPIDRKCICIAKAERYQNAERGWSGITDNVTRLNGAPMTKHLQHNVWITASRAWMKAHLLAITLNKPLAWRFNMESDVSLMNAWLASITVQGMEILDPEAREHYTAYSVAKLTVTDLAVPPDLLILQMGVKSARNSAMPEVFIEALNERAQAGKYTWVWDDVSSPLGVGMPVYSAELLQIISSWERVKIAAKASGKKSARDALIAREATPLQLEELTPEETPK